MTIVDPQGQNQNETVLTPQNVNSTTDFRQLFSRIRLTDTSTPSRCVFQTLAMEDPGTLHDVVFVAHGAATASMRSMRIPTPAAARDPLARDSFIDPAAGITTIPSSDTKSGDITPEVGVTGTPVIDPSTNTLYVVTATEADQSHHRRRDL